MELSPWANIFPGLVFLSQHTHASATFAPYLQACGEESSGVQFSSTQKSLSWRPRAWKLPWGAADALSWSYREFWSVLWVLHSRQSVFWASEGGKRRGVSVSLFLCCFRSIPSLPLGLFMGEDGRAHSKVLWYTVIILSKVFSVIWIFSTAVKWTPAFKNQALSCKCFLLCNLNLATVLIHSQGQIHFLKVFLHLSEEAGDAVLASIRPTRFWAYTLSFSKCRRIKWKKGSNNKRSFPFSFSFFLTVVPKLYCSTMF